MLPTSVSCWMSDRKFTYSYKDMKIQDKPLTTYQNIYSPLKITSCWRLDLSYSTVKYFLQSVKCHCEVMLGLCSASTVTREHLVTSSLCGSVTPTEDSLGVMCWGNMGMVASLHIPIVNSHTTNMLQLPTQGWIQAMIKEENGFYRTHFHTMNSWQTVSLPLPHCQTLGLLVLAIFVPATLGISCLRSQQSEHSLVTSWWAQARQWPHVITHI